MLSSTPRPLLVFGIQGWCVIFGDCDGGDDDILAIQISHIHPQQAGGDDDGEDGEVE